MKTRKHVLTMVLPLMLLGPIAVGCAAEEPEDKPYVPQITHSPQDPADDENADEGEGVEPEVAEDLENGGNELEPPEIPDEIYENTLEGAEAAGRHFFEVLEYGFSASDPEPLSQICFDDKGACYKKVEAIKKLRDNNFSHTGGEMTLSPSSDAWLLSSGTEAIIIFEVFQEGAQTQDEQGKIITKFDSVNALVTTELIYDRGRWFLQAYNGEEQS